MAGGNKLTIETIGPDDPRMAWPSTAKALNLTGLSKRTLENRVRDGSVVYVYGENGERLFDPKSLDEVAGVVTEAETANDLSLGIMNELRVTVASLAKANGSLLTLATAPAFQVIEKLALENDALRARCRVLEESHLKNIEAFETALSQSSERELAKAKAVSHENRLDKGFEAIIGQLPNLINQLSFKKAISGFIGGLTDEQKGLLFEMLRPDQLETLTKIIPKDEPKGTTAGPSATASNGAGS